MYASCAQARVQNLGAHKLFEMKSSPAGNLLVSDCRKGTCEQIFILQDNRADMEEQQHCQNSGEEVILTIGESERFPERDVA